ncbi:MAG: hypothetical protein ACKVX7_14585 [Planctomycetota bacterium]
MTVRIAALAGLLVSATNCTKESETGETADRVGATATASGACALFTTAEIGEILGNKVQPGKITDSMETICHWDGSSDGKACYAQIQVIKGTEYWVKQTLASGYEELPGIGKEAFVVPEFGGWAAHALTDTSVVAVALNGGRADRERTVQFLRSVLNRMR